jgi:hypothetical protein
MDHEVITNQCLQWLAQEATEPAYDKSHSSFLPKMRRTKLPHHSRMVSEDQWSSPSHRGLPSPNGQVTQSDKKLSKHNVPAHCAEQEAKIVKAIANYRATDVPSFSAEDESTVTTSQATTLMAVTPNLDSCPRKMHPPSTEPPKLFRKGVQLQRSLIQTTPI